MPLFHARCSLDGSEYLIPVEADGIAEAAEALVAAGAHVQSVAAVGPESWRERWRQSPIKVVCAVLALLLLMNVGVLVVMRGMLGQMIGATDGEIVVPVIVLVAALLLTILAVGIASGLRGSRRTRVRASDPLGPTELRAAGVTMPTAGSSPLWRLMMISAIPGFVLMAVMSLIRFWRAETEIVDASAMLALSSHMLYTYAFSDRFPDPISWKRANHDDSAAAPSAITKPGAIS
ncbi:MAG: hypothetical protein ACKVU4_01055 [Phycisphaerales bacterium]